MAESDQVLHKAIRDLAEIRRAISRAEGREVTSSGVPDRLHLGVFAFLALSSLALLVIDFIHDPSITSVLYYAYYNEPLRYVLIGLTAGALILLAAVLYVAIWNASRKNDESFTDYITRNFFYLRSLSFGSDLFVKFAALSVALLAGRGDWVAPLLVLFIGDYLLQGRIFILPFRVSLILGFACLIAATIQLGWLPGSMKVPFALLCLVSVLSCIHVLRTRASPNDTTQSG